MNSNYGTGRFAEVTGLDQVTADAHLHDTPRLPGDTEPQTTWNTVAHLLVSATGYE